MDFKDKVAIITGASEGIGFGISSALAKQGAKVYLVARNSEKLEKAENEIKNNGGKVEIRSADITQFDTIKKVIDDVYENEKKLNIFVNNAGTWKGQSLDKDFSEIWGLIEFNMKSPYQITNYLAQKFKSIPDNDLKILTVASQASLKVFDIGLGYGPAKMGLISGIMHLRKELSINKIKHVNLYNLYPNTVATQKMLPAIRSGQVENPVSLESVVSTAIELIQDIAPSQDARIGFYPNRGIVRTYLTSNPNLFYNAPIVSEKTIDANFDPDSLK
jgi:2-dehydro-3-deoxy-D-gluconate 5-dehydrogenase